MIDLFMPFRAFLKYENVCSDNNVFRMHYKVTVIMLLVFTLLVSSKQFFGEPIHCMSNSDKDSDKDAINSYCWIYGTYTLKSRLGGKEGINNAYVGVGPESFNDEQIKHTYYQWVCFVLLGQAVMFYTPRYLWKIWEGGRLKALAADLGNPMVSKDWSEFRRGELISYLTYTNIYTHNTYALRYALCELLNLVNVVGQIFLLDIFLGGAFRNYGAAFAAFTHTPKMPLNTDNFEIINPMDQFFPKLTKCWLRSYGPTGTLQLKDRLSTILLVAASAALAAPASSFSNANEIQEIHKDPTTHDLLASLGLKKLRVPAAHHRKRLAEQGRRHATGDSRMFVIKLPPNTSYYNNPEPAPAAARTLPLQMTGNGKPARVYHWNIPVLRKLAKNRPQARFDDDVVDVESTPTWPKGLNDHPNSIDGLAYYVPAKKTSFRKYFSGNGKPKSFYIIEKNKKTAEYHRLLP